MSDRAPSLSELQHVVFQALGEASVCWDGDVFDSSHAQRIGDELVLQIVQITGYGKYDTPESREPKVIEQWLTR